MYSVVIFEDEWTLIENPQGLNSIDRDLDCAPDWPNAPSDSPIWESPPVSSNVLDSFGVRFERPLSIIVRCYVLLDDREIEVWTRRDDANQLMGFVVGLLLSFFVIRFLDNRKSDDLTSFYLI